MEERLTDLESRYMQQERTIQELLDLIYRHQQSIDRLGREMAEIREQLQIALPSLVERPEDEEPPPHY
jgi:SlyX protein